MNAREQSWREAGWSPRAIDDNWVGPNGEVVSTLVVLSVDRHEWLLAKRDELDATCPDRLVKVTGL